MFFKRLAVLFYVTVTLFYTCFMLLYVSNIIDYKTLSSFCYAIYVDDTLKLIVGSIAGVILFINLMFFKFFSVSSRRDKIIAFDNPSGRVTVSLLALEDLVRKMLESHTEIKDAKIRMHASRKGIQVIIRLVIKSEVSIPELTSLIQSSVKKKIHESIGVDERVEVTIFVGKILSNMKNAKKNLSDKNNQVKTDDNLHIPFEGYRA